jgi:5'-nucleotidase
MKNGFWIRRLIAASFFVWLAAMCGAAKTVDFKILAINDFHGQITCGPKVGNRPVGGAAELASYLESSSHGWNDRCFLVEAGDLVGASQPECALLNDVPALVFLNYLSRKIPAVGVLGNHELDKGVARLRRLFVGDSLPRGLVAQMAWTGVRFPVLCANMVDSATGIPLFPSFEVKKLQGIEGKVAFVGVTLKETPSIVSDSGIGGTKFLDEAETVNYYVAKLRAEMGIHAFVVLLHQGGEQPSYNGWTDTNALPPSSNIVSLVSRLDDDVAVVCSAHSHSFTNAIIKNCHGHSILVTQAYSKGTAYAEIVCSMDEASGVVVSKRARIVTTWGDAGVASDTAVEAMVDSCAKRTLPIAGRIIGFAGSTITRVQNGVGESPLGDLIADAQRSATNSDFALVNSGGIRADCAAGTITWGELYSILPFQNELVTVRLTGQQVYDALNLQWMGHTRPTMLEASGLAYTWDSILPVGNRVVEVRKNGKLIDKSGLYAVTVNSFLAQGGDNFSVFKSGRNAVVGPMDLDALCGYVSSLPQPIVSPPGGRDIRIH